MTLIHQRPHLYSFDANAYCSFFTSYKIRPMDLKTTFFVKRQEITSLLTMTKYFCKLSFEPFAPVIASVAKQSCLSAKGKTLYDNLKASRVHQELLIY
jgi:hypothetical protein